MKKLRLLCVLLILCALFTACGDDDFPPEVVDSQVDSEEEPSEGLHILLDLGPATPFGQLSLESECQEIWQEFREEIAQRGGPRDVVFEFIFHDYSGEETGENSSLRDADLTRVRTEIMAGKGPDVFIAACDNGPNLVREEALFKYPDQAMARKIFLPLDSYMEQARFMEWDKLTPVVMEAGRNEEGQQILPLTYTMPLTVFSQEECPDGFPLDRTFYEMAESDTPWPATPALRTLGESTQNMDIDQLSDVFLQLADYSSEQLAFSEEELLRVMETAAELESRRQAGEMEGPPSHYHASLGVSFNEFPTEEREWYAGIGERADLALAPFPTVEGGYGASITSFAAVNRNTRRPEDAFFVLDYLLSLDCQRSAFYLNMTTRESVPTHEELFCKQTSVKTCASRVDTGRGMEWDEWYLFEKNWNELGRIREHITSARFRCELDKRLAQLYSQCILFAEDRSRMEDEVHKAYSEMQMMLAES